MKTLSQDSISRLSLKTLSQDSHSKLSLKTLTQDSHSRLFLKAITQKSISRLSHKILSQDYHTRLSHKILSLKTITQYSHSTGSSRSIRGSKYLPHGKGAKGRGYKRSPIVLLLARDYKTVGLQIHILLCIFSSDFINVIFQFLPKIENI